MTQEALAKASGVSRAYLSRLEMGPRLEMGRHDPPLSRLRKLAKALGVKVSVIYGERGADCPVCGAAIMLHNAERGHGGTWEDDTLTCGCGSRLHAPCYWGCTATLKEFQEHRRQLVGGRDNYAPPVVCAQCRRRSRKQPKFRLTPDWRSFVSAVPSEPLPRKSYLWGFGERELTDWGAMHRRDLDKVRQRLARAKSRTGVYRTKDGADRLRAEASRLRQRITSYAAERRARRGDECAIARCSWLRTVASWRADFARAWEWAKKLLARRHAIGKPEITIRGEE